MGRFVILPLLGLFVLASTETCPSQKTSPGREILCYTSTKDVNVLADSICKCTTLVHEGHDLLELTTSDLGNINKDLKKMNPTIQFVVSIKDARGSLETSGLARQEGIVRIASILNEVDGIELNVTAGSKERLVHFVQGLKEEMIRKSNERRILLALPTTSENLAKKFDIKGLSKYVDLFTIPTHFLTDNEENHRTFHPSRLMGLFDMLNTDSLVDLVHGLGTEKKKILISLPASGYKFILKDKDDNTPRALTETEKPMKINREKLCQELKEGEWTIERDEDLTAPYAFKDQSWIAFEDKISAGIKGKYVILRDLAGIGIRDFDEDIATDCSKTITEEVYHSFTNNKRKTRQAVLTSLQGDIYNTEGYSYPDSVKSSDFRINRIVDSEGKIHAIRENTQTEFSCPHQGYFVHPKSCNRFYRCVKFDQGIEEYSVFEFDCPPGLSFDERISVCNWPGSLPKSSACPGSPEIAPSTPHRFQCPGAGYYADHGNCRSFFACMDMGGEEMMAYEFQCPYGLVFDEGKLACEWPWLVPNCAGAVYEQNYGGGPDAHKAGDHGGYDEPSYGGHDDTPQGGYGWDGGSSHDGWSNGGHDSGNKGGHDVWNNGGHDGWNNGGNDGWNQGGHDSGNKGGNDGWNNGGNDGGNDGWNQGGHDSGNEGGHDVWNNGGHDVWNNGGHDGWNNGGNNGWNQGGHDGWSNGGHDGWNNGGDDGWNNGGDDGWNQGGHDGWNQGGHDGGNEGGNHGGGNQGGHDGGNHGGHGGGNQGGHDGGNKGGNHGGGNQGGHEGGNHGGHDGGNHGGHDGGNQGGHDGGNHGGHDGGNHGGHDGGNQGGHDRGNHGGHDGGNHGGHDGGNQGGHDGGNQGGHDGGNHGGHDGGNHGGHDGGNQGGHDGGNHGGHDGGNHGGHDGGNQGGHDGGNHGGHDGGNHGGHDGGNQGGHDGGNHGGHDGGNHGGHDGGNQGGHDGGNQGGHDGGNHGGHDGGNHGGHDGGNQGGHDGGNHGGHDGGNHGGHDGGNQGGHDGGNHGGHDGGNHGGHDGGNQGGHDGGNHGGHDGGNHGGHDGGNHGGHDGGNHGGHDGGNQGGHDGENQGGHDGGNHGGHDGGNHGGHDGGNQGGHDGENQGGHDGGNHGGHDGGNHGGHDGGNQGGHDGGNQGGHDGGNHGGHDGENHGSHEDGNQDGTHGWSDSGFNEGQEGEYDGSSQGNHEDENHDGSHGLPDSGSNEGQEGGYDGSSQGSHEDGDQVGPHGLPDSGSNEGQEGGYDGSSQGSHEDRNHDGSHELPDSGSNESHEGGYDKYSTSDHGENHDVGSWQEETTPKNKYNTYIPPDVHPKHTTEPRMPSTWSTTQTPTWTSGWTEETTPKNQQNTYIPPVVRPEYTTGAPNTWSTPKTPIWKTESHSHHTGTATQTYQNSHVDIGTNTWNSPEYTTADHNRGDSVSSYTPANGQIYAKEVATSGASVTTNGQGGSIVPGINREGFTATSGDQKGGITVGINQPDSKTLPGTSGYVVTNGVKTTFDGTAIPQSAVHNQNGYYTNNVRESTHFGINTGITRPVSVTGNGNQYYTNQAGQTDYTKTKQTSGQRSRPGTSVTVAGNNYYTNQAGVGFDGSVTSKGQFGQGDSDRLLSTTYSQNPFFNQGVTPLTKQNNFTPAMSTVYSDNPFLTNQAGTPTARDNIQTYPTSEIVSGNEYHTNQAGNSNEFAIKSKTTGPGYRTNEYHDNGGRGTIRYNNGLVTHKYTEDDVKDNPNGFPAVTSSGFTPEYLGNEAETFVPPSEGIYTKEGFTKTGPTRTGITTAQVGGSGSYVAGSFGIKPYPSSSSTSIPLNSQYIGENAFGNSPKNPPNSDIISGTSGYQYTKPTIEFNTGHASIKEKEQYPKSNIGVYNHPVYVPSTPVTHVPTVVNTHSYTKPTDSVDRHPRPFSAQNYPTVQPIGYTTGAIENYQTTVFEAARLPIAISTVRPVFNNGYKTVVSSTKIPVVIETSTNDYGTTESHSDREDFSYVAVPVEPAVESVPVVKKPPVNYQPSKYDTTHPVVDKVEGYSYEKPNDGSFGERIRSTTTIPAGKYDQPQTTIKPQIYRKPQTTTTRITSYERPVDAIKPEIYRTPPPTISPTAGVIYLEPFKVHDTNEVPTQPPTTPKDSGYKYPKPTVKFITTPAPLISYSTDGLGESSVRPTIDRSKVDRLVTNYDRSSQKFSSSNENNNNDGSQRQNPSNKFTTERSSGGYGQRVSTSSSSSDSQRIRYTTEQPTITTYSGGRGKSTVPSNTFDQVETKEVGRPKGEGKVIVKYSDLHPILLGKLGGECTCKADPFIGLRSNKPLLIDSSKGKIDLRDYDESDVYVELGTRRESGEYNSESTERSRIPTKSSRIQSTNRPSTMYLPSTTSSTLRVSAGDIEASFGSGRIGIRAGKSLGRETSTTGNSLYGGGRDFISSEEIGVLEMSPEGRAECARAGLFRHPKFCNKFYACHWDNWKKKFVLHVFNCPIHLTFDKKAGACNWPSKGPACQDNKLLV